MAGYHRNLDVISRAAQRASVPFMNFFVSQPFNGRGDITEAQLRWQAYTSLAYGASGLLYFCYWTPAGSSFLWGNAIIAPRVPLAGGDVQYVPGPHYAQAGRLNGKLKALGTFLLHATSTGVFAASGNGTQTVALPPGTGAAGVLAAVAGSGAGPSWSTFLGAFTLPSGGGTAVLVHNQAVDATLLLTLTLASNATAALPQEVDGSTGVLSPAYDDAPYLPGWQVALEEGDARLFVWPA
jgi:hypothetical protein